MGQLPPILIVGFVFIFGLNVGSFLNVVIHRLPLGESIFTPGTVCRNCNNSRKRSDNIPMLGYILLGGRCRTCGQHIPISYPAVELLVAVLFVLCYFKHGLTVMFVVDIAFVSLVVALVFIDLHYGLLPNAITYPGSVVLLLLRVIAPEPWITAHTPRWFGVEHSPDYVRALVAAGIGGLIGAGTLWLIREIYYRQRHVEGLGLGNVKMMLMIGVFFGWQLTALIIVSGWLLAIVAGVAIILRLGDKANIQIEFGVILGSASIIALFEGSQIWDVLLGLMYR
jgi:leader peptidase (prepilin peptidase)/N-methyltransferase